MGVQVVLGRSYEMLYGTSSFAAKDSRATSSSGFEEAEHSCLPPRGPFTLEVT